MGLFDSVRRTVSPNTIDDFKAMVGKRGGLSRPNRFNFIMTPPAMQLINTDWQGLLQSALTGNLGLNDFVNDPRDISLLCDSCTLPGRQINVLEHEFKMHKQTVKKPVGYINEDVTVNFLLTNDYYMKKVFDKWLNAIVNPKSYLVKYKSEYTSDIIIQQLDKSNRAVYGVKLLNAYPTNVTAVTLDNAATDQINKLSVTFTYEDYTPEGSLSSTFSGLSEKLDFNLNPFS